MKKYFVAFFVVVVMLFGIVAETADDVKVRINETLIEKGIDASGVVIEDVNLSEPPEDIVVDDVQETNIKIYRVQPKLADSFYVITPSGETVSVETQEFYYRQYLSFGIGGEQNSSTFLETATGVGTEESRGYVMMREGSITGISTNLEVLDGDGEINILIYKNGEQVGFRNSFDVSSAEVKSDYDLQSRDIVKFKQGDVLSVYVESSEGISYKDVITMIELMEQ